MHHCKNGMLPRIQRVREWKWGMLHNCKMLVKEFYLLAPLIIGAKTKMFFGTLCFTLQTHLNSRYGKQWGGAFCKTSYKIFHRVKTQLIRRVWTEIVLDLPLDELFADLELIFKDEFTIIYFYKFVTSTPIGLGNAISIQW